MAATYVVSSSRGPRRLRSAHRLDGGDSRERPKIGVRDPGVFGLDGKKEVDGVIETSV